MVSRDNPLGHILSELDDLGEANTVQLALTEIHPRPNQPRKHFDPEQLEALAHSIREIGVIQPLLVHRQPDGRYILIAGERRLRAAEMAGLESVPAYVLEGGEEQIRAAAPSPPAAPPAARWRSRPRAPRLPGDQAFDGARGPAHPRAFHGERPS